MIPDPKPRKQPTPRILPLSRDVAITGTGSHVPERVLTNADLETMVNTSDEWIITRTGIRERRIAGESEFTSHMAEAAALRALENASLSAEDLDLIIVATVTPDTLVPGTACIVQGRIGAKRAAAFDLSAACSGFLYALETGRQFVASHKYSNVLVIGADKLSFLMNWSDRNTCVLFGDGAGAAILQPAVGKHGILSSFLESNGHLNGILQVPGGGCAIPITAANAEDNPMTVQMNGRETFRHAVNAMVHACIMALDACGLKAHELACVIPHQANIRIIEAIADRLDLPPDKFFINLERFGNTSAAAVPIALDEANRTGRIKPGDKILMVAFGGGLTYAATVVEW